MCVCVWKARQVAREKGSNYRNTILNFLMLSVFKFEAGIQRIQGSQMDRRRGASLLSVIDD